MVMVIMVVNDLIMVVLCVAFIRHARPSLTARQAVSPIAVKSRVAVTAEAGGIICTLCILTALRLEAFAGFLIIGGIVNHCGKI